MDAVNETIAQCFMWAIHKNKVIIVHRDNERSFAMAAITDFVEKDCKGFRDLDDSQRQFVAGLAH